MDAKILINKLNEADRPKDLGGCLLGLRDGVQVWDVESYVVERRFDDNLRCAFWSHYRPA